MTILEILEAHQQIPGHYDCQCGWGREAITGYISHRAHVADVLEKHMQERMAHERAHTIQMIRDQSDWTQDETDEYGRVTLEGYLTIGTRELDEIEDGAGADRMCFSLADWEKREEQVRTDSKAEALEDMSNMIESKAKILDPEDPTQQGARIGLIAAAYDLTARANQYKDQS